MDQDNNQSCDGHYHTVVKLKAPPPKKRSAIEL